MSLNLSLESVETNFPALSSGIAPSAFEILNNRSCFATFKVIGNFEVKTKPC